jgi:hypothetical protein
MISDEARNQYEDYRRRKEWRRFNRRVLKRDGGCAGAAGKATIVHRSYGSDVMAGNNDEQLVSVCDGCHTVIHFDGSGAKRASRSTSLRDIRDDK